jgi:putative endopeptidase
LQVYKLYAGEIMVTTVFLIAAHLAAAVKTAGGEVPSATPSGVDLKARDLRIRPGDGFFQYALGGWYAATPIPPDQSEVGADGDVSSRVRDQFWLSGFGGPRPNEPLLAPK